MDSAPDIVDISSDDDDVDDFGVDAPGDFDWISELLDEKEEEGFDDITVVGELSAPAAAEKSVACRDGSDDDCLILDGDPDRPVAGDCRESWAVDGSEEDLLIVGEKGQLACRDYPHPRHLCVRFPFSSTPHEKYCDLCHCYVCDSPAPCIFWSSGVPLVDHCHSTDKEGNWKALRNSFKLRNMTCSKPQNPPNIIPMMPTLPIRTSSSVRRHHPVSLPMLSSKSGTLRPCPATSVAARTPIRHSSRPNIITNRGQRPSGNPTEPHSSTSGAKYVQRDKHGASVAPIIQSHAKYRKVVAIGNNIGCPNINRSLHSVSDHHRVYRLKPHCTPATTLVEENMKKWQEVLEGVAADREVSNCGSKRSFLPQTVSSQPITFSQYLSSAGTDQNADIYTHSAPQMTNSNSLNFGACWLNNNAAPQNIEEHSQTPASIQAFNPLGSGDSFWDSFLDSSLGAGSEPGPHELDPDMLLPDFSNTSSSQPHV